MDNWKCVIWSDETKINHIGSDIESGLGKRQERASVIDLWRVQSSLKEDK